MSHKNLIPDKSAAFVLKTSLLCKESVVLTCTIDVTKAYLRSWPFSAVSKSSKDDLKGLNYPQNRDQHP